MAKGDSTNFVVRMVTKNVVRKKKLSLIKINKYKAGCFLD